jgi:6-phosphogluconolactonase
VNNENLAVDPLGRFLFVTNNVPGGVLAFTINQQSGALTAVQNSPFSFSGSGSLFGLAVEISGQFLYVSDQSNSAIVQFTINQTSGALVATGSAVSTTGLSPEPVVTLGIIH